MSINHTDVLWMAQHKGKIVDAVRVSHSVYFAVVSERGIPCDTCCFRPCSSKPKWFEKCPSWLNSWRKNIYWKEIDTSYETTNKYFMNITIISGYVGKDAEVKTRADGKNFLSFTLASTEARRDGEKSTTWWNCTMNVFGDGGPTLANYIKKGAKVVVVGRTAHRTGDNGDVVNFFNVTDIELMGGGEKKGGATAKKPAVKMPDDDEPF